MYLLILLVIFMAILIFVGFYRILKITKFELSEKFEDQRKENQLSAMIGMLAGIAFGIILKFVPQPYPISLFVLFAILVLYVLVVTHYSPGTYQRTRQLKSKLLNKIFKSKNA